MFMFNIFKSNFNRLGLTTIALTSSAFGIPYFFQYKNDKPEKCDIIFNKHISSVDEALKLISNKKWSKEAINYLEFYFSDTIKLKETESSLKDVDNISLCLLSLWKSKLIYDHKVGIESLKQFNEMINSENSNNNNEDLLFSQHLNKIFNAKRTYFENFYIYSYKLCEEHDSQCIEDGRFKKYWIKHSGIIVPLIRGVVETENGDCKKFVSKKLIDILFLIFVNNRDDLIKGNKPKSRKVCQLVIKILSNIAKNDKESADLIVNSGWFILLSKMIAEPVSDEEIYWARKVFHNILFSYKYETFPIPCDIIEIFSPSNEIEPVVDIVFIHGIQGSGLTTWRSHDSLKINKTRCWPADWLLPEIHVPTRGIATDYLSSFWFQKANESTVSSLANNLERQFFEAGIGRRPIIFISHSLGGILLKKILTDNAKIRENTLSVLFIAVPHRGSPLSKIFSRFPKFSDEVKFLRPDSEGISKIHEQFLNISEDVPTFMSLSENVKHGVIMMYHTVPPESAYFEKGSFYHIDNNHRDITKPKDKNDPVYILIKKFIIDSLRNLKY